MNSAALRLPLYTRTASWHHGHITLNVQLSDPSIDSSFHGRPVEFQSSNYISSVL